MTQFLLIIGALAAVAVVAIGFSLQKRYRAAIDYAGIGRPYPIGNSVLAFAGIAMMIGGGAALGVLILLIFF
jgi:hypothetical protein